MNNILDRLPEKSGLLFLAGGAALVLSQLPGLSFFLDYAPPAAPALVALAGGVALAVFGWVFAHQGDAKRRATLGVRAVIAALVAAIVYSIAFNWMTAPPPPQRPDIERAQIGFGLADFSLSEQAKDFLEDNPDYRTPQRLLLAFGAWSDPGRVWRPWTIGAATLILALLFIAAYVLWAYGLACMAWSAVRRAGGETSAAAPGGGAAAGDGEP